MTTNHPISPVNRVVEGKSGFGALGIVGGGV